MLASTAEWYVSSLQVGINLYPTAYRQPMVVSDADFAAFSATDKMVCVMAVGGPAVTAIETAASGLGISPTSFTGRAGAMDLSTALERTGVRRIRR
jgi:hypothetical protein